jgi:hypothetical protein
MFGEKQSMMRTMGFSPMPSGVTRKKWMREAWTCRRTRNRDLRVRGGSVSNMVLDKLLSKNIQAQYIEGGIAGKEAGGKIIEKPSL